MVWFQSPTYWPVQWEGWSIMNLFIFSYMYMYLCMPHILACFFFSSECVFPPPHPPLPLHFLGSSMPNKAYFLLLAWEESCSLFLDQGPVWRLLLPIYLTVPKQDPCLKHIHERPAFNHKCPMYEEAHVLLSFVQLGPWESGGVALLPFYWVISSLELVLRATKAPLPEQKLQVKSRQ